jgi:myo-inositol-1-phosphate synthase
MWILVVLAATFFGGRGQIESEKLADTVKDVQVLTKENRHLVTSLQAAIVESCEQIGNERAQAAREQLHEEIVEAEHPDPEVIAAFNLPPEKIDELIAENVAKLKGRLKHIKLVDCASQYHISPGSGARRRDRNVDSSTP